MSTMVRIALYQDLPPERERWLLRMSLAPQKEAENSAG